MLLGSIPLGDSIFLSLSYAHEKNEQHFFYKTNLQSTEKFLGLHNSLPQFYILLSLRWVCLLIFLWAH